MKWEYKYFNRQFDSDKPNQLKWFNELGAEGWEIITVNSAFDRDYTSQHFFILVKRPVQ